MFSLMGFFHPVDICEFLEESLHASQRRRSRTVVQNADFRPYTGSCGLQRGATRVNLICDARFRGDWSFWMVSPVLTGIA